jgi:hypothetical protein
LPFWKQSRCHRTTRLCQHSNLCGNCMRLVTIHPI